MEIQDLVVIQVSLVLMEQMVIMEMMAHQGLRAHLVYLELLVHLVHQDPRDPLVLQGNRVMQVHLGQLERQEEKVQ